MVSSGGTGFSVGAAPCKTGAVALGVLVFAGTIVFVGVTVANFGGLITLLGTGAEALEVNPVVAMDSD